jgi:hypothetical protein
MGANVGYRAEVMRFKESGKWYETIEVEVSALGDWEVTTKLREERDRRGDDMIWLITGKGLDFEVPRIIQ